MRLRCFNQVIIVNLLVLKGLANYIFKPYELFAVKKSLISLRVKLTSLGTMLLPTELWKFAPYLKEVPNSKNHYVLACGVRIWRNILFCVQRIFSLPKIKDHMSMPNIASVIFLEIDKLAFDPKKNLKLNINTFLEI